MHYHNTLKLWMSEMDEPTSSHMLSPGLDEDHLIVVKEEAPMMYETVIPHADQEQIIESPPSDEFLAVCKTIAEDMPHSLILSAWEQYDKISQQCVLEGTGCSYFACCIYIAMCLTGKVGKPAEYKYSLSDIIAVCKLSPLDFFDKLNKWVDMLAGPRRLLDQANRIQNSLAISAVVYKKLLPVFRRVFLLNEDGDRKPSTYALFQLVWLQFLILKKSLTSHGTGDDLMNCFHVLLCCVDMIYEDLTKEGVEHCINPEFSKLLAESEESALECMCRMFEGVVLDAKHLKQHWFTKKAPTILECERPLKLSDNIDIYIDQLNEAYSLHLVKRGELDERMFIPASAGIVFDEAFDSSAVELLRRGGLRETSLIDAALLLRMSTQSCLEKLSTEPKNTNKSYVISGDQFCPLTPMSIHHNNINKLNSLIVADGGQMASSNLERMFMEYRDSPIAAIAHVAESLGDRFEQRVREEAVDKPDLDPEMAANPTKYRDTVHSLFYHIMERIVGMERERNPSKDIEFTNVFRKEDVVCAVYTVAVELVLFSHDSQRAFPWSLDTIRIYAIQFYKVIEIVIRAEANLSREMVRHLNRVEERVLEELAWQMDSPLWATLSRRADGVPPCESVWSGHERGLSSHYSPLKRRRLDDDGMDMHMPHPSASSIFFRKIYFLSSVRLSDLCDRIRMDERQRCKVWTLLEYVLRTETSLLAGRHLDQNLMCIVYVIAKITKMEVTFHHIMEQYRHQPQASSRVYREVLIDPNASSSQSSDDGASRDGVSASRGLRSGSAVPAPGVASAPPTPEPHLEHADLIKYYNRVFIGRVEDVVMRIESGNDHAIQLLVMPNTRPVHQSPVKRSLAERVTVQPLLTNIDRMQGRQIKYNINRSPSKDLRHINRMIQSVQRGTVYAMSGGGLPAARVLSSGGGGGGFRF